MLFSNVDVVGVEIGDGILVELVSDIIAGGCISTHIILIGKSLYNP